MVPSKTVADAPRLERSERSCLEGVRIVFVLPSLGTGGAERQALLFARHLARVERAHVHIIALGRYATLVDACRSAGISYEFFDMTHRYRSRSGHLKDLLRFTRLLRCRQAQVVLPYCMFQNVLCALTWRLAGGRVCIWNQRDEGRGRLEPWIEKISIRLVSRFISNSQHGAEFLRAQLGVPDSKIEVVPNGIELPRMHHPRTNWRARLGLGADAFLACMVANLHAKKDHATLLTAWRHVLDALPEQSDRLHLLLAGRPDDMHAALLSAATALNLTSNVHFLGEVTDVDDLWRSVDLAVFSSYNEGIPNAVLEPMAHGLAVVATRQPGIEHAVGDSGAQLLAAPRDPRELANKLLLALSDPELRRDIGCRLRSRVEDEFSVGRMARQMTHIVANEWTRVSQ